MKYKICVFLLLTGFFVYCLKSVNQEKIPSNQYSSNSNKDIDMASYKAKVEEMVKREKRFDPDSKRKSQECIDLVNQAVKHLQDENLEVGCHDFAFSNVWWRGEIFVFVLDEEGYIICYGDNPSLTWKNIDHVPNFVGEPILNTIKKIDSKGEWINYRWNNGFKSSYIKPVILNSSIYYVGAGYFPQSKDYITEQLVKTAIQYFKLVPHDVAFTRITNPHDAFVLGDISMYVGDFEGNIFANSFDPGLAAQNMLNYQDTKGQFIIKDIINTLRKRNTAWIANYWKNSIQRNYIEKSIDQNSKNYFFAGTYIPDMNEIAAIDLIDRAIKHIKMVGKKKAFVDFSSPISSFNEGDLSIVIYDFEGNNLANGEYPILVGKNLLDRKDKNGKLVIQEIIKKARIDGWGFVTTVDKNSSKKIFIKTLDTSEGKIIIGVGVYIQSKYLTAESMVEKGLLYLSSNSMVEALNAFTDTKGEFYFGDIYMFMYNVEGIALVNGEHKNMIWHDYIRTKDDKGGIIIKNLIQLAQKGGGWYIYPTRNSQRRVYVRPIFIENKHTKRKEMFILGSGYFL